jgi:sensitive to high expression protein 9
VPDEDLPSHIEAQRWTLTKRFNKVMDGLMPRIAQLSQRINSYTGTDYSGIEALRQEIKEQEQLVKVRSAAFKTAKADLDAARATQSASQKEVVGLLERKHSWSAADLERYMSLIRSEHLNEQAVQGAKDCAATAERALEEARTRLEKRERAQYHEEQIWSDTIRRNSTWVTFGLMGLNILLLLANVVAIEPWRRRRLVREFRSALEEHKVHPANAMSLAATEADIYDAVGPVDNLLESLEEEMSATDASTAEAGVDDAASEGEAAEQVQEPMINTQRHPLVPSDPLSIKELKATLKDLFSDRIIQTRRVDMTTATLQGVVVGTAVAGLISFLLRPR